MKFRAKTNGKTIKNYPLEEEHETAPFIPLNRIFYGPPGTGKTWHTIDAALEILDADAAALIDRVERKECFDTFVKEGRVRFVTFHQSYSYEDFVEGIRPITLENEEGQRHLSYEVKDGIFKEICNDARPRSVQGLLRVSTPQGGVSGKCL